jgi:hypothetical protein
VSSYEKTALREDLHISYICKRNVTTVPTIVMAFIFKRSMWRGFLIGTNTLAWQHGPGEMRKGGMNGEIETEVRSLLRIIFSPDVQSWILSEGAHWGHCWGQNNGSVANLPVQNILKDGPWDYPREESQKFDGKQFVDEWWLSGHPIAIYLKVFPRSWTGSRLRVH